MSEGLIRVVVADHQYLVREGVRQVIELEQDMRVVAGVGTPADLVAAVHDMPVDVVITDVKMPPTHRTEGIETAHRIRSTHPTIGVVVLSSQSDAAHAVDLFRHGTAGLAYLLKENLADRAALTDAVRATAAGGSVIDPPVVDAMVQRMHRRSALDRLTPREREVLTHMAAGRTNLAIAGALHLSVSAVEKHISSIFDKFRLGEEPNTHRRVAAVLAFLQDR